MSVVSEINPHGGILLFLMIVIRRTRIIFVSGYPTDPVKCC